MSTLIILLALPAFATTYYEELPVKMDVPVNRDADDLIAPLVRWMDVAVGYSDQVVASDWSYVTCEVSDENVIARFSATPATWPTTWPATATCTAGGHTLVLDITDHPNPGPVDWDPNFVPANGITVELIEDGGSQQTYELPPQGTYVYGSWPGRLSKKVVWRGVLCQMSYWDGDPKLRITIDPTVAEDSGYCAIPNSSGGLKYLIPLVLDRIP